MDGPDQEAGSKGKCDQGWKPKEFFGLNGRRRKMSRLEYIIVNDN